MPAIDPRHKQEFIFECDAVLPEADRPTFFWRPLTASEFHRVVDADSKVSDVLDMALLGWKNVHDGSGNVVEFSSGVVSSVLTVGETATLAGVVMKASTLRADEKKDSGQQLPIDTGSSADSAPTPTA
jgi:hypothetical protein